MSTRSAPHPKSLVRRAVAIEVALLRAPLLAADQLAARAGAAPAIRSTVQRGIAALDAVARRVSADGEPEVSSPVREPGSRPRRGATTPAGTRSAKPKSPGAKSAESTSAESKSRESSSARSGSARSTAAGTAPSGSAASNSAGSAASESAAPDESELVEQVAEELLDEQEVAPLAGELAEDEELRRVQAELNAKRLVEEQQERPGR